MLVRRTRRFLFLLFLVQEAVVFLRATPEERAQAPMPPLPALFGVTLFAPLLVNPPVPRWLERLALLLQGLGLSLEVAAMTQLARHQSFGIHPTAATKLLQRGAYRLEHPIYLGLLINLIGWTLPVPPCLVAVLLTYRGLRRAVAQERVHLAQFAVRHRGIESFLWPEMK